MSRDFITAIIDMQKVASTDPIRFFITGVCLDSQKGMLRMRSTNGHAMAERLMPMPDGLDIPNTFIVDPESLKLVMPIYRAAKKLPLQCSFKDGRIVISCPALNQSAMLTAINGPYPDTDKVKPKESDMKHRIALNADLLASLCDALRVSPHDKLAIIDMDTSNPLAPIRVTVSGNAGVIMPMRIAK